MTQIILSGPRIESKTCARCTGTGKRPGGACPTCHGAGGLLTKRGQAAREYMDRLLVKPAADVSVGDMIWFSVGGMKIASDVKHIETNVGPTGRLRLHGMRKKTGDEIAFTILPNGLVSLAHTPAELESIRCKVEEYQAGLTRTGEVSQRRKSIARAA